MLYITKICVHFLSQYCVSIGTFIVAEVFSGFHKLPQYIVLNKYQGNNLIYLKFLSNTVLALELL